MIYMKLTPKMILQLVSIIFAGELGLSFFYADVIVKIKKFSASINSQKAIFIMEQALKSKWEKEPVWLHGDLAIGNILLKNGKINAIIDFGGVAVGDPACDLALYWNFLRVNLKIYLNPDYL